MEVSWARVHYHDTGEGTAIVCLHKDSANARDMAQSDLPSLAGDFGVVTVDRPGLGHSARPGTDWWSLLGQANVVREVSHRLGNRHPILLGHSWSSAVVLKYLLLSPCEVAGGIPQSPVTHGWNCPPKM